MPVGVLLQGGRVDMHMVGHIVLHYVDAMLVGSAKQGFQFLVRTETPVELGGEDGPIAVVTRETGVGLGGVVLVAVAEDVFAPCVFGVLGDRADP